MRWRVLVPVLGVILLGAVVFSVWPSTPATIAELEPRSQPQPAAPTASGRPSEPRVPVAAAPPPPTQVQAPVAAPGAPEPDEIGELDPEVDPEHLKALGLGPEDVEPLDGGPLHALTREGIHGAVKEELPAIAECYEGWLQQSPGLSGKMKIELTIVEIPGRGRAKVMQVLVADGGLGHLGMEGCVRNVFKGMRFEAPRGGEMRVSYPLSFSSSEGADGH